MEKTPEEERANKAQKISEKNAGGLPRIGAGFIIAPALVLLCILVAGWIYFIITGGL